MLVKIKSTSIAETFISEEPIGQLAAVYFSTGGKSVKEGTSATQGLVAGVSIEGALSGVACRVVTHGVVSGVICGAVVSAGDRVTCTNLTSGPGLASGPGLITPLNTITPAGSISQVSGYFNLLSGTGAAGGVGVDGTSLSNISGAPLSGLAGFVGATPAFTGTAFNTARVLGKALDHGGIGSGVRLFVDVGG